MTIPVLFVSNPTYYSDYDCFDLFDITRDAFSCRSRSPLIAHPPCRLFSRLRSFSTAPIRERLCAYYSISKVRQFGGIVEHPRSSLLWHTSNCNLDGSVDSYGGFLRSVNLSWFGFPAEKKTMLYFVGISPADLPPIPLLLNPPEMVINSSKKSSLRELPKKSRSLTPPLMIDFFIQVLAIINQNKK